MFTYRITFLGGSTINIHAPSPREAWEKATKSFELEVVNIKFLK